FRTRIWEDGSIVLVQTRWHEDDLAGRLLLEQRGQWQILRLPALAETQAERDFNNTLLGLPTGQPDPLGRETGEPLCPQRYSREALEQLRKDVGSLAWHGQYQGAPRSPEGNRFKRHWFPIVEAAPADLTRVRYWDKAGTAKGGDSSAGVRMGRDRQGIYYVEDGVRRQWSSAERNAIMLPTAKLDGTEVGVWCEQEPGASGKESAELTVKLLAGFAIYTESVSGSKEVRAEPFAAQCEAGNVRLVRGPWNGAYIEELCSFPNGKNDDQVDGSSGAFNKLALGYSPAWEPSEPDHDSLSLFAPERVPQGVFISDG